MTVHIATSDPWAAYESMGHKKPRVPEPAFYGLISLFLCIVFVAWMRRRK